MDMLTSITLLYTCFVVGLCPLLGSCEPHAADLLGSHGHYQHLEKLFASKGLAFHEANEFFRDEYRLDSIHQAITEVVKGSPSFIDENGHLVFSLTNAGFATERCISDSLQYIMDIRNDVLYARRMWKSFGKLPDEKSIYTGMFKDYGDVWLCRDNKPNVTSGVTSFGGQYCTAYIPLPVSILPPTTVSLGTCFPSSCSQSEIQQLSDAVFLTFPSVSEPFLFYECMRPAPWKTADVAILIVLCISVVMVLVSSIYDVYLRKRVIEKIRGGSSGIAEPSNANTMDNATQGANTEIGENAQEEADPTIEQESELNGGYEHDEGPRVHEHVTELQCQESEVIQKTDRTRVYCGLAILEAIFMSFSAVTNGHKILSATKPENNMAMLKGLRVLSMWWFILRQSLQLYIGRLSNPVETARYTERFEFLALINSSVSLDTFFVLSGFYVTYWTLKSLNQNSGRWKWARYYVYYWWRFTPVYLAAMAIWGTLTVHFGQGVFKMPFYTSVQDTCKDTWWTHPLYINNLYPWPNDNLNSCMSWSWYLALEMQFYIISPLVLIPLHKNGKAGMTLVISMMIISLSALFGITWYYGYTIKPGQGYYNERLADYPLQDTYYAKPYTRIPPYLVGIVLGYLMFTLKGQRMKLRWWTVAVGWTCALGTLFGVVYGTWSGHDRYVEQYESVLYIAFHRVTWGTAIAWIGFACMNGYGGPVNAFLGWNFWVPLSRLTFCAYLIHPIIIYSAIHSNKTLFHVDVLSALYFYTGNVVLSYASAVIISLVVEAPTINLGNLMFGKGKGCSRFDI